MSVFNNTNNLNLSRGKEIKVVITKHITLIADEKLSRSLHNALCAIILSAGAWWCFAMKKAKDCNWKTRKILLVACETLSIKFKMVKKWNMSANDLSDYSRLEIYMLGVSFLLHFSLEFSSVLHMLLWHHQLLTAWYAVKSK